MKYQKYLFILALLFFAVFEINPAQAALTDGLSAFWKLDEASGTRYDSFGSNNLADNNTVTQSAGKIGNAAQFTFANTEYLSVTDNASLSAGAGVDFTITGWFQIHSDTGTNQSLVTKFNNTGNQREYELYYSPYNTAFNFAIYTDGTAGTNKLIADSAFVGPSLDTWYFVVAWYDHSTDKIYIQVNNDGTPDEWSTGGNVFNGSADFRIGSRGNNTLYLDGRVDLVGFWKRVLTAGEKTQLYNSGNGLSLPTVTTQATSVITKTTATANGNIMVTGGENNSARGFNYGPTMDYGSTISETGSFSTGVYTASLSGLTCGTTYYIRAFSTNSFGTNYGSDQTFTTSACDSLGLGYLDFTANTDIVEAGCFKHNISTAAANFGNATAQYNLNYQNTTRIAQSGNVNHFEMYFASKPAELTSFKLEIWRQSSSNAIWNRIHSEDMLSQISGGTTNILTPSTTWSVLAGDYIGYSWTASGAPGNFLTTIAITDANSVSGDTYYRSTAPSTTDYNWISEPTNSTVTNIVPIKTFMRAPVLVGIGDSHIAGWFIALSPLEYSNDWAQNGAPANLPLTFSFPYTFSRISGISAQNMGIGGQKNPQILARFDTDVIAKKPKMVIIEGGVNDIYNNITLTDEEYLANTKSMVETAIDNGITPIINLMNPFFAEADNCITAVRRNELLRTLAGTHDVIILDNSNLGKFVPGGPDGNLCAINNNPEYGGMGHFNEVGYALMADNLSAAINSYAPPFIMGVDDIYTSATTRVYGNEKFKNKLYATNNNRGDLALTLPNSSISDWIDVAVSTWETDTANRHKTWTESSTATNLASGSADVAHTVGDLESNKFYNVQVDEGSANLSGSGCSVSGINLVCQANSEGKITFTYTGHYSTKTFDVSLRDTIAPIISDLSPDGSIFPVTTSSTTISLLTNEIATCKYSTTSGTAYASMTAFDSTNNTEHSTNISGLSAGNTYNYYFKCQDLVGNETVESSLSFEVAPIESNTFLGSIKIKIKNESIKLKKKIYSLKNKFTLKNNDSNLINGIVKIYKNNKLYKTISVGADGIWKKTLKLKDDFSGWFKIRQYDQYGTLLSSKKAKIKVDIEKPKFTKFITPFYSISKGQGLYWEATDNEEIDKYKIYFNGKIDTSDQASFEVPRDIKNGIYTIRIKVSDKAGNSETKQTWVRVRG